MITRRSLLGLGWPLSLVGYFGLGELTRRPCSPAPCQGGPRFAVGQTVYPSLRHLGPEPYVVLARLHNVDDDTYEYIIIHEYNNYSTQPHFADQVPEYALSATEAEHETKPSLNLSNVTEYLKLPTVARHHGRDVS